jgi:hypothetical protein
MRSRTSTKPRRPIEFNDEDEKILLLMAGRALIRQPWSYDSLSAEHMGALLGRSYRVLIRRTQRLCESDKRYLKHLEQPAILHHPLIFGLASRGADVLRDSGHSFHYIEHDRANPHTLLSSLMALSFEMASKEINTPITVHPIPYDNVRPDWHVFRFGGSPLVHVEIDLATESIRSRENARTIEEKYMRYTSLPPSYLKDSIILFYTTSQARSLSMVECLKRFIDEHHLPHRIAERFAFTHIKFNRYFDYVPKPSPWAAHIEYVRAGSLPPFIFQQGAQRAA